MQIGDLVRVPHGHNSDGSSGYTGIIVSIKRAETVGIVSVLGTFGWEIDVLTKDLEILSANR